MDFFKSVFSADPDSSPPDSPTHRPSHDDARSDQDSTATAAAAPAGDDDASPSRHDDTGGGGGGMWSFGGLIKTISSKSESVIQTYRRDLEEFGSGLRKETESLREAAARAVLDLPGSLEAGASAAQESLETVGQAIDEIGGTVWRGTAEIIAHGKDAILALEAAEAAANSSKDSSSDLQVLKKISPAVPSKPYNRFEAQVLAIQSDASTFSEEPEDAEDFSRWREEFDLPPKEEEIEILCYENSNLESFLEKLVPKVLDYETFWCRYYYRVHKLKQAEDARSELVKRVIARDDEEDLSWEVDDDEEEVAKKEEEKQEKKDDNLEEEKKDDNLEEEKKDGNLEEEKQNKKDDNLEEVKQEKKGGNSEEEKKDDNLKEHHEMKDNNKEEEKEEVASVSKEVAEQLAEKVVEVPQIKNIETQSSKNDEEATSMRRKAQTSPSADEELQSKLDDNTVPEVKGENSGSGKDSDFTVVSTQPSIHDEDDLGWDEIEDLGEHDDKKAAKSSGSPPMVDIIKRLSTAEEDEDLSWDIEDDDEPAKA